MHSIRIPTDNDLQQYPHVFFRSPDTWDASVLDHGTTPSLLEEINQDNDGSLFQHSIFGFADNKGDHLTWKILTDETNQIITRSTVRSTTQTSKPQARPTKRGGSTKRFDI